ncbi:DUF4352 domain-containing protein [Rhodococcus sp. B10]|uniref:DUF4352 domain-containing protein n=1 Tax=Rhodococcus sp. B10 TaxID=2695876 RepID=UPI001431D444|nr:DUF4352 domain-containing protein [Rhodococcus sp. B10]NIL74919.1 hypothetical protein [Rhodococcus sp. B10]
MTYPNDPNQPQHFGQPGGHPQYAQQPYGAQPQGFPQGQPYAQPQPPAAKKKRKWPWVVGGVVVVLIIAGMAGGKDEDKSTTTAQSTSAAAPAVPAAAAAPAAPVEPVAAAPAPAPTKSAPGIGEEVRDGKFGFTVTGVESGIATVGDNPYLQKDAMGQFVLVHVTVTNTSDKAQSYFGSNQKLFDAQGREFENDTMAAINFESETAIGGDINPGLSQDVTIVFDIPVDAVPTTLEVHDSMFSGGAEIALS